MSGITPHSGERRCCYLFPGQGAYLEEVFLELANSWPQVRQTFEEIDLALAVFGAPPVVPLLFNGSPPRLNQLVTNDPDTLQVALFGSAMAVYRILESERIVPDVLVGHSLGEIAALVAGGAFTVGEGTEIVYARSQSLRMAADTGEMFAVRCGAQRARALVDLMECDSLVVAVENGSHQTVLSGPLETLSRVETIVREAGLSGSRIPSPYPFHSPLLASVAEDFRQRLETNTNLSQCPLRRAVFSPILGRLYNDDDEVAELLASHLVLPVRFGAALRQLHGTGVEVFVECGARSALSGIVGKVLPGATTLPTVIRGRSPVESIQSVINRISTTA